MLISFINQSFQENKLMFMWINSDYSHNPISWHWRAFDFSDIMKHLYNLVQVVRCAAAGFSSHTGESPAGGRGQRERTIPCVLTLQKQVLTITVLHLMWKVYCFCPLSQHQCCDFPIKLINIAVFGSRDQKCESCSSFIYTIGQDWLKKAVVTYSLSY